MTGALRGDVHWHDYGPDNGAELSDNRPALVISNDQINRQLELCITVPMSTTMPNIRFLMQHVRIEDADSWASTRQLKSVHQGLLGDFIAKASPEEMNTVILSIAQRLARQNVPGQLETIHGTFRISAGTIWDLHFKDTRGQDSANPVLVIDYNAGNNMAVVTDIEYAERPRFTGRSTHNHPGQPASGISPHPPRSLHRYHPSPPDSSRRNSRRAHSGRHQTTHIADRRPYTLNQYQGEMHRNMG